MQDNHNSVLGIRGEAIAGGARVAALKLTASREGDGVLQLCHREECVQSAPAASLPCLFAIPAESNFSGERYDMSVVRKVGSCSCRYRA